MAWFYDLLSLVILIGFLWALLDAVTRPSEAFAWADTMKKWYWVGVLGIGTFGAAAPWLVYMGISPVFAIMFRRGFLFLIFLIVLVYYLGPIRDRMKNYPGGSSRRQKGSW